MHSCIEEIHKLKICSQNISENIKVRFYEQDDREQVIWEDWGRFTEADVHHQYAIALKTPPYRKHNIDESVRLLQITALFSSIFRVTLRRHYFWFYRSMYTFNCIGLVIRQLVNQLTSATNHVIIK